MGIIFDIQRFSVNDGPGIRSTIFLKGCPLKCLWCHNPESNLRGRQLYCDWMKCMHCGKCVSACNYSVHKIVENKHVLQYENCTLCGDCIKTCPNQALGFYGEERDIALIVSEVMKDVDYYNSSGGGVTISGGEPMFQFEFVLELAKSLKARNLHVCMETSGYAKKHQYEEIAPYIDLFLYDYKATGEDLHRRLTGVGSGLILENMRMLLGIGKKVILRCPMIPGYNLSEEHLKAIASISREGVESVEIIPYHDMGIGKAKKIGSDMYLKGVRTPEQKDVDAWIEMIKAFGGIRINQA
ncbi:glycyl-radical enzyme activating protein [Lacrimispora sp.]|uniref:glycyl-radical enzyme activating protein n=1 Tax=Lacrimispora sp. TaxID=2719234 RepID=UPI0028A734E5|nr:glycyl-radical enzyme activating protein [Lacrimispora sp.]